MPPNYVVNGSTSASLLVQTALQAGIHPGNLKNCALIGIDTGNVNLLRASSTYQTDKNQLVPYLPARGIPGATLLGEADAAKMTARKKAGKEKRKSVNLSRKRMKFEMKAVRYDYLRRSWKKLTNKSGKSSKSIEENTASLSQTTLSLGVSSNSCIMENYHSYLKETTFVDSELRDQYHTCPSFRRLRRNEGINEKRVYSRFNNEMLEVFGPNMIITVGEKARFYAGQHKSTKPILGAAKAAKILSRIGDGDARFNISVFLADDFNTSAKCCRCETGTMQYTLVRKNPYPNRTGQNARVLRWAQCDNSKCCAILHRDWNAACNQAKITKALVDFLARLCMSSLPNLKELLKTYWPPHLRFEKLAITQAQPAVKRKSDSGPSQSKRHQTVHPPSPSNPSPSNPPETESSSSSSSSSYSLVVTSSTRAHAPSKQKLPRKSTTSPSKRRGVVEDYSASPGVEAGEKVCSSSHQATNQNQKLRPSRNPKAPSRFAGNEYDLSQ